VKAFLLAAGIGSRLRPLTETTPKCMIEIDGQPLLDIWLHQLHRAGVDEVLVNVHHLPGVVQRYIETRHGPPVVRSVFEPELLGSAGTLVANKDWVHGEPSFLVCNADNLTDFELKVLVHAHGAGGAVATLGVFRAPRPSECGIVQVDPEGLVTGFVEKPSKPAGDLANAGIYAFNPSVLEEIPDEPPKDIGYDLLPQLVGRAQTVLVGGYFRDIGTVEAYQRAQEEWPQRRGL
jgi:mannose-1-phosphate guanylyltransferase